MKLELKEQAFTFGVVRLFYENTSVYTYIQLEKLQNSLCHLAFEEDWFMCLLRGKINNSGTQATSELPELYSEDTEGEKNQCPLLKTTGMEAIWLREVVDCMALC